MPESLKWDSKIILAKIEATEGTDAAPTGGANAMLLTNVSFTPMSADKVMLDYEYPWLGPDAFKLTGMRGRLKGRVMLAGSGTAGTPPAWAPLLRGCAVSEMITPGASAAYSPQSSGFDSLTWHFWIEGTRHVFKGARGSGSIVFPAQGLAYVDIDLLGLMGEVSATARAVPDFSGFKMPEIVSAAFTPVFTVNAVPLVMRDFTLSLGNKVEPRLLVPSERIVISEKKETFRMRVEATPLATFNPFVLAGKTPAAISLTHGNAAGNIFNLSLPRALLDPVEDLAIAQRAVEWNLAGSPLPAAGNDQWVLTCT